MNNFSKVFGLSEILFLLFWCSGYIGAKIGVPLSGTFTLLFYRYLIVFVLVLLYLLITKQLQKPNLASLKRNFVIGFFAHFIWLVAILKSFEYNLGAGSAALIASLQPALAAFATPFVFGESNNKWIWFGIVAGFFGVLLYALADLDFNQVNGLVYLLPTIATLSLTFTTIYERKKSQQNDLSNLDIPNALLWQSVIVILLLAPFAIFMERLNATYNAEFLFSVVWLAFICSLAAYGFMIHLIRTKSAVRVSLLQYFAPPITMLIAFFVFGEHQGVYGYVSLAVVIFGFVVFHYGETIKVKKLGKKSCQ